MTQRKPLWLEGQDKDRIAYNLIEPVTQVSPTIVFLPGYRSDRQGGKALYLEQVAEKQGWGFLRLDYHAHGDSPGDFHEGTIERWTNNVLDVIDHVTQGSLVLVGSSMGGWIMVRAALSRPDRVKAMVGIAAAPDFTHDLMLPNFKPSELAEFHSKGYLAIETPYEDGPYIITQRLLDNGADCLVLRDPIDFDGPVSLVHGMKDTDVPFSTAEKFFAALSTTDVHMTLIKDGEHRLSRDSDLAVIKTALFSVLGRAGLI